jgi:uncharacterized protein (DUF3820 family)
MDSVTESVRAKFEERAKQGFIKYGVTMDRGDLSKRQWLIHSQEEAMDFVVYLEKLIQLEDGTEAKPKNVEGKVLVGSDAMPFGKYLGRPLDDVPDGYLRWLSEQDNFSSKHPELAKYIEGRLGGNVPY